MPFKSLTDAEYEDIFKSAMGNSYEVESNFMGDICKSLSYRGFSKPKNVEDEVVTPTLNEALTPGEAAKQEGFAVQATRTENVSQKPNKVKLYSAQGGIGEKKIIPVFKSKAKTKINDHPKNNATRKIPQKARENDNLEQEKQNAKHGKKMTRDCHLDHCETTHENKDSDATYFATPIEKASPIKLDKKSSETSATVKKGKKNVNKDCIHLETSGSSPITLKKKSFVATATVHKSKKNVNKENMHSESSGSDTMKSASQSKKTKKKSNFSNITKEMELSVEADEESDNCHSTNQTATPTMSKEVLTKESQCKPNLSSNSKVNSESSQLVPSQQEIPLSQPPVQYSLKQRLKWLQVRREIGVWVQCCNENCSKWRYLESTRDPQQVPRRWFCNMNPDKSLASCAAPQKGPSIIQELDLIENQYTAGSVVWAHLAGYPWWPAMVDDDPDVEQYYWVTHLSEIPTHYNVVFFDEKAPSRAWITPKNLRPFYGNETRREYKVTVHRGIDYSKRLAVAKAQAVEALEMDFKLRLQKFSFLAKFKGPFVMNTRSALSKTYASQSQEEFKDNDDMILLLKEVKHRRKHSLATNNSETQKRLKISENTVLKGMAKSRSEASINSPQSKKRKDNKIKEVKTKLKLKKHLTNNCKQSSETNTHVGLSHKEITDMEDTYNEKAQYKIEKQNNAEFECMKDIHHEKEQQQLQSDVVDNDDETIMSEDMFGEDDSSQIESVHEKTNGESPLINQNEHPQETPVIKPEDNHDSASSPQIIKELVPLVCTDDEELKSSVNIQKKDELEQITGDSFQIPSSLLAVVGTGGAEEMTSSTKVEPGYHNNQSSSLPSTSFSNNQAGCKVEYPDVLRKCSPSQSLNDSTHASLFTGENREQLPPCVSNNTGACSVLNASEGSDCVGAILEVPLVEYPDDAVVPQGFSPSSRVSSPDFEVEE